MQDRFSAVHKVARLLSAVAVESRDGLCRYSSLAYMSYYMEK